MEHVNGDDCGNDRVCFFESSVGPERWPETFFRQSAIFYPLHVVSHDLQPVLHVLLLGTCDLFCATQFLNQVRALHINFIVREMFGIVPTRRARVLALRPARILRGWSPLSDFWVWSLWYDR